MRHSRLLAGPGGGRKFAVAGVTVAGLATAGSAVLSSRRISLPSEDANLRDSLKLRLHPTLVECIAGAVGEIVQIAVLYPLDTIKVRCQAGGLTSAEVVKDLVKTCRSTGQLVQVLYAGVLGAAACSVLIGAVHYASFETTKRLMVQHGLGGSSGVRLPSAVSSHPVQGEGIAAAPGVALEPGLQQQPADDHKHLLTSSTSNPKQQHAQGTAASIAAARDAHHGGPGPAGEEAAAGAEGASNGEGKLLVNLCASVVTAVLTAVVESPIELFRHNQQAGLVPGNFLNAMVATVRKDGPGGLYWGFLPHCFEALPHDMSEMLVMGCMKDAHVDGLVPGHRNHWWMRHVPVEVWDLAAGAASGAAAVLVSQPLDTIKTFLQTHSGDLLTGKGLYGSARLFLRTGKRLVASKGVGSLYYGVAPRLLQQVPSSMMGWWAVHAVARALEPYTTK